MLDQERQRRRGVEADRLRRKRRQVLQLQAERVDQHPRRHAGRHPSHRLLQQAQLVLQLGNSRPVLYGFPALLLGGLELVEQFPGLPRLLQSLRYVVPALVRVRQL